jgi:hypothetical protein
MVWDTKLCCICRSKRGQEAEEERKVFTTIFLWEFTMEAKSIACVMKLSSKTYLYFWIFVFLQSSLKGLLFFLIWSRGDWLKKYGFPGSNNYTAIRKQDTPYDRYMWLWILEVWRMDCSLVSHFHAPLSQLPWILGLWTAETYILCLSKDSGSFQHPLNSVVIYIHRSVVAILEYGNL